MNSYNLKNEIEQFKEHGKLSFSSYLIFALTLFSCGFLTGILIAAIGG